MDTKAKCHHLKNWPVKGLWGRCFNICTSTYISRYSNITSYTTRFLSWFYSSRSIQWWQKSMENISRGPTFGDFVTILTKGLIQNNTVPRLQSTRVQALLSPSSKCVLRGALLDPDPNWESRSGYGAREPIESGSTTLVWSQCRIFFCRKISIDPLIKSFCTAISSSEKKQMCIAWERREILVRGQSYFSRLPKYWPPPSPSPHGESVLPPQQRRGEDTLAGRRGGWGVNILEDERNRVALLQWSLYAWESLWGQSKYSYATLKRRDRGNTVYL
jgi:hypothetical protein